MGTEVAKMIVKAVFVLSVVALHQAMDYKVEIKTADLGLAGTNDNLKITVHGYKGDTDPYRLDTDWYDDFEPGVTDQYQFYRYKDVGRIYCVTLETDGYDDYLADYVYVTRYIRGRPNDWWLMENTAKTYLTRDAARGKPSIRLCNKVCDRYIPVDRAEWVLEEMEYDTEKGTIHPTTKERVGSSTVHNSRSSVSQSTSLTLATSISTTMSFSHVQGVTVATGVTFSAGIPKVVSGSITVSKTTSNSNSFTKSNTVTESVSFSFPCVAAPYTDVRCVAYQEKYQLEVPYVQKWRHKTQNCLYEVEGVAIVDSDSNISMTVTEL